MNLLVPGGLLVIGVIILVALFFLIRSEPSIKESASVPVTKGSVSVPPPVPTKEQEVPEARTDARATSSSVQTLPVSGMSTTPSLNEQFSSGWYPLANGQFYTLKNELHNLHSQAQELEYQIRTMVDMLEQTEHTRDGRSLDEEQPSVPSATTQAYQSHSYTSGDRLNEV